jgi:TetR/AcrR family transcriptional regulator
MLKDTESQKTEEKILEAAKIVFMENGLDSTRMQDIAERAGISRTSLNYYFRTKENLFQVLLDQLFENIVPEIENIIEQSPSFLDKIDSIIEVYDSKLKDNTFIPSFVFIELQRNPKLVSDFISKSPKVQQYLSFMNNAVRAEMDAGNIRDIPLEQIISTAYSLLFVPYILDPVLKEYWNNDQEKRDNFFNGHKENTKKLMRVLLTPNKDIN